MLRRKCGSTRHLWCKTWQGSDFDAPTYALVNQRVVAAGGRRVDTDPRRMPRPVTERGRKTKHTDKSGQREQNGFVDTRKVLGGRPVDKSGLFCGETAVLFHCGDTFSDRVLNRSGRPVDGCGQDRGFLHKTGTRQAKARHGLRLYPQNSGVYDYDYWFCIYTHSKYGHKLRTATNHGEHHP